MKAFHVSHLPVRAGLAGRSGRVRGLERGKKSRKMPRIRVGFECIWHRFGVVLGRIVGESTGCSDGCVCPQGIDSSIDNGNLRNRPEGAITFFLVWRGENWGEKEHGGNRTEALIHEHEPVPMPCAVGLLRFDNVTGRDADMCLISYAFVWIETGQASAAGPFERGIGSRTGAAAPA